MPGKTTMRRLRESWFERGGRHTLENRLCDLKPFLNRDHGYETCLDIGCAEGHLISWLRRRFDQVDGFEKSEKLFERARALHANDSRVSILRGDVLTDPLPNSYDVVFLLGVLHYFRNDQSRLQVLRRTLQATRHMAFLRTIFLENRDDGKTDPRVLEKATSLKLVSQAVREAGARWFFIDNRYRGDDEYRLGDLVVVLKNDDPKVQLVDLLRGSGIRDRQPHDHGRSLASALGRLLKPG